MPGVCTDLMPAAGLDGNGHSTQVVGGRRATSSTLNWLTIQRPEAEVGKGTKVRPGRLPGTVCDAALLLGRGRINPSVDLDQSKGQVAMVGGDIVALNSVDRNLPLQVEEAFEAGAAQH
eukprot:CAMPEP_0115062724 /NCGR_PEP_ID=MMETSP0227-20121206/8702_1 /TAXON_ID=89957 /ORGANISM="Polarella glacialis, Strain CCMP 1383" /LENGTH=118 /DNA_ID=CAMNT_0002448129 /DNA_START=40 /DNA_END=396 /DNA_ORIENTATION=+